VRARIRATLRIPAALKPRLEALGAAVPGLKVYAVGGCVRDWFLGRPTKDLDLAVEGDPEPLAAFCLERFGGRADAFGEFGTHRLFLKKGPRLDIATARRETYAAPAALPAVEPASLREDLYRRDFTINAMAVSIAPQDFGARLDPWGGLEDLKAGRIRVLHSLSFRDDPTRIFRAARFAGRFGFALEAGTQGWLAEAVAQGHLFLLSRERVRQELVRLLEESDPRAAFDLLEGWGVLPVFFHRFSWEPSVARSKDPWVRLGLLALHLEEDEPGSGTAFLDSLHLERGVSVPLQESVRLWREKASPRGDLSALASAVLKAEGVPTCAYRRLLINGGDLVRIGRKPGKALGNLLSRAARAQWKGKFRTRAEALRWLRKATKKSS
jgi:hypothetical protein